MTDVPIPLHLAVHVLGTAVAAGVVVLGATLGRRIGPTWPGLVVGGALVLGSHLLVGPLVVQDGTLPLVLRAAGYAGLAVGAAGPLRTPAAAVALVAPVGVHLLAGLAGAAAAVAALRGRVRTLGPVVWLVLGLALWAAADVLTRTAPLPAGLLSLAGSLAVALWVVARARDTLLARTLVASTALVLATVLVLSSVGGLVVAADVAQDQASALEALAGGQASALGTGSPAELGGLAAALVGQTLVGELRAAQEPGGPSLDARASRLVDLPGVDVAVLVSADGRVVGSWDRLAAAAVDGAGLPPADEVALAGDDLVAAALAGTAGTGTAVVGRDRLLAAGAVPVAPEDADAGQRLDRSVGVLLLARDVSTPAQLRQVAAETAGRAALLVGGQLVATSVDADAALGPALAAALAEGGLPGSVQTGDGEVFAAAAPVGTQAELVLLRDAAVAADLTVDGVRSLFLAALLGLVVAGALAAVGARAVVAPIRRVTEAAEQVAGGGRLEPLGIGGHDEVGRLADAFDRMTTAVAVREDDLARAAATEADLRHRLEVVTSSLSEALLVVDEHGTVTRANPAAQALLGGDLAADAATLVGQPVTRVLRGTGAAGERLVRAVAAGEGTPVRGRLADGTAVLVTSAPLRDADGSVLGRVHLLRDVTREEQVERMKTEFLSNVSHELRTPLTPIRGYAEVLRRRELPHEQVASIADEVAASAARLQRVLGMLVDFSALEAGRVDVRVEPLVLADVLADLLAGDVPWDGRRTVDVDLPPTLPRVRADRSLLQRLLLELVDNAVRFSSEAVEVTAHHGGGRVRVLVRDHGPGVPQDIVDGLGEAFRQGDGSATRRVGGLGLGLSLAVRVSAALGGSLEVTSPPDGGTAVVVELPAAGGSA